MVLISYILIGTVLANVTWFLYTLRTELRARRQFMGTLEIVRAKNMRIASTLFTLFMWPLAVPILTVIFTSIELQKWLVKKFLK